MKLIEVRNLGVRYTVMRTRRNYVRRNILDLFGRTLNPEEFWALRNVDFDIEEGETLGVIGHNGAGKSTLCKVLAGIFPPDEGVVDVRGVVSPVLSLGSSFKLDLTGRENIHLSAALMNLPAEGLEGFERDVVEFVDLGDFIDNPVRTYSNGMKARLAFAVATGMKPDLLLLDEVFGVGDRAFQLKSRARLHRLMEQARAIVIVSHSIRTVRQLCEKVLWLHRGVVRDLGPTEEVSARYEEWAGAFGEKKIL